MTWKGIMNADVGWTIFFMLGAIAQLLVNMIDKWYWGLLVFFICAMASAGLWQLFKEASP